MGIYKPTEMTSNSLPSPFVASASSIWDSDYAAWKAFDGLDLTHWASSSGSTTGWLKIDLGFATLSEQYQLSSFSDGGYEPSEWTLSGSNDDSTWDTLDTQTGISWTVGERKTFTFTNSTAYRYYKITVSAITSGNAVVISRFALYIKNYAWTALPTIGSGPTLETDIRATLEQWRQNMEDINDEWSSSEYATSADMVALAIALGG